jgi:hypothetical protein
LKGVAVEPKARDSWKASLGSLPEIFVLRLFKDSGATKPVEGTSKWSRRTTLLFTVAVCGAFWLLVAYFLLK